MTDNPLISGQILYEDNHCLVVNKPARLLTVADHSGDENLLDQAKAYLRVKYQKPGDVFLGVVHRLDRPVSGVVLFARTSKSAARLSEQFRTRALEKIYWALVSGNVNPPYGVLEDWLTKTADENLSQVVPPRSAGARFCRLSYERINATQGCPTLVQVRPETGRSHQIRVQLAHQKWPIAGDRKYGSTIPGGGTIGLHALRLTFEHPTRKEMIVVQAPPPEAWGRWNPNVKACFERLGAP